MIMVGLSYMDYVRDGKIQGRYMVFFKAYGPVYYHLWHSPLENNHVSQHVPKSLPFAFHLKRIEKKT